MSEKVQRSPRRLLKALGILIACSGILAIIIYSPLFTLQRVDLKGNNYLQEADIMQIARLQKGKPLFSLETSEVTQNLLHDLRIESAVVKRRIPDTLEITISERVPVATVASDYGYLDFDRQGKVIASYYSLKKMPIPMITGVVMRDLYIGDDNDNATVKQLLEFLQQLDENTLNQISEINISNPDNVVAYTVSSVQIRLGKLERLDEKAKLTKEFIANLKDNPHEIEYVDFSYKAPFIRLRKAMEESVVEVDKNAQ